MSEPSPSPPVYSIDSNRWDEAQAHEMAFWQKDGVFDREFARVEKRYGPVIEEIDRKLSPGARVIDVGSGPTCAGRLFRNAEKTFIDPLMQAYERRWPDRMPGGDRLTGHGESIPYPDSHFDVAVSFNAIDHMLKPWDVLTEIRRVLKPDGVFILGIFCHPPVFAYSRLAIEKVLPFLKDTPHPFSFTRHSIERLVKRYFVVRESRCVYTKPSRIPSLHRTDWIFVCEKPR